MYSRYTLSSSTLEKELIEKSAKIDFLLKERSKPVSYKKEHQNIIIDANQENEEGTKPRNSTEKKRGTNYGNNNRKRNTLVVGDSMLTGISEKSLSKKHNASMTSFSGGTTEKIIQNVDDLQRNNPDDIVIHVGTNDITNGVNLLNSVEKIVNQVSDISPRTTVAFSSIIVRKDKKHVEKPLTRLKKKLLPTKGSQFH